MKQRVKSQCIADDALPCAGAKDTGELTEDHVLVMHHLPQLPILSSCDNQRHLLADIHAHHFGAVEGSGQRCQPRCFNICTGNAASGSQGAP